MTNLLRRVISEEGLFLHNEILVYLNRSWHYFSSCTLQFKSYVL
jgi:hypothetical protein